MTQTVSSKEKTQGALKNVLAIFKWELRRCSSPLIIFGILAAVFTAVILTLSLAALALSGESDYMYPFGGTISVKSQISLFQTLATYAVFYTNVVFTIIYTISIYSYLHNKRKADMYGAMPVSRRTFYFAKTASAYLLSVVPTLFFFGIIAIISVCFGQPILEDTANVYVMLLLGSAACISFYGLLSICCGTTLNSVLTFLAINFAYPVSSFFIRGTVKAFFPGLPISALNGSFIMKALNPMAAYDGANVVYWLIFTAACLALGYFLIKKRKSEAAQTSFAYYLPCHIVKLLIAFIAGMFLGNLFGALNVFGNGYLGFVFGFILGSIPAFVIAHLILYHNFSKFLITTIQLGCLIVVAAAGLAVCNFDVFGYNEKVPDIDKIKSAGIIDLGNSYFPSGVSSFTLTKEACDDYTDEENIKTIRNHHVSAVKEFKSTQSYEKFIRVWQNSFIGAILPDAYNEGYFVSYTLDNGATLSRLYNTDYYYPYSYDLENLLDSYEYFMNYNPMMHDIDITSMTLEFYDSNYDYYDEEYYGFGTFQFLPSSEKNNSQVKAEMQKLTEAYCKDVKEKGIDGNDEICSIYIGFDKETGSTNHSFLSAVEGSYMSFFGYNNIYTVYTDYTNTIEAMKEIGILNADGKINKNSDYFDSSYSDWAL